MNRKLNSCCILLVSILVISCGGNNDKNDKLPVLGRKKIIERFEGGKTFFDTLEHKIADFSFLNQDSAIVTNDNYEGKIYIADFFFTSCPTICPTMKKQMLRVYEGFEGNDKIAILSHTIDPEYDNVMVLRDYAERLGVSSSKWNFVTGDLDEIYDLGEKSYMVTAGEDEEAPGGYIHSGAFLLVDMNRRIRGIYDGTIPEDVDVLMNDIGRLLMEYEGAGLSEK
ncbi:MAG: protein SCO1/2 [Cyclobacteriaceae bacterium]|jgi:protein SCO1/2